MAGLSTAAHEKTKYEALDLRIGPILGLVRNFANYSRNRSDGPVLSAGVGKADDHGESDVGPKNINRNQCQGRDGRLY